MSLPFKLQHICLLSSDVLVFLLFVVFRRVLRYRSSFSTYARFLVIHLLCHFHRVRLCIQRGGLIDDEEEEYDVSRISFVVSMVLFIEMCVCLCVSHVSGIRCGCKF